MEEAIGFLIPILGIPASWIVLRKLIDASLLRKIFLSGVVSIVIMVVFVFASVLANSVCIEYTGFCEDHGDGNMSYWFNAFFMMPLYFIVALASTGKNA